MKETKKYYWYVSYNWALNRSHGFGACCVHTSEDWFPVQKAKKLIEKDFPFPCNDQKPTVIILNFFRVSKECHDEFQSV